MDEYLLKLLFIKRFTYMVLVTVNRAAPESTISLRLGEETSGQTRTRLDTGAESLFHRLCRSCITY